MKTTQLQVRVSPEQKQRLNAAAKAAGVSLSTWVLSRALPETNNPFETLTRELARKPDRAAYTLAALNDMLADASPRALARDVAQDPVWLSDAFHRAYVAAMVEHACHSRGVAQPAWVGQVAPLDAPYFASTLVSLRPHLLRSSPPPFRARNIFIDATLGARV